ncbi:hypothetical protein [Aquimarina pacifica]|uniref:hypothetical protein n=1 Tax=Aquimarina pacifica TaxID=1296415 RepID=UPI00046F68C5|nr:hypothetical protein [Aquimarina pacifica]
MKLVELIDYFRNDNSFESFCEMKSLDVDSEVIEVYMEKPFDLSNDLVFFEIEKTEGNIEYIYNSTKFFNLFDFYYFLDVMEKNQIMRIINH